MAAPHDRTTAVNRDSTAGTGLAFESADDPLGDPATADLKRLLDRLTELRADLVAAERDRWEPISSFEPDRRASASNLIHYMALRRSDLRELQDLLARYGFSSLGRAEAHVLWTVDAVLTLLRRIVGAGGPAGETPRADLSPERAAELLERNTFDLLGAEPAGRRVHVMVTVPSEAATEYAVVRDLLAAGMDCMRINCAHDGVAAWSAMIAHLRRAEVEVGRACRVLMDLTGPRLRTGPVEPGPEVVRARVETDELGRVVRPARIWLTPSEAPADAPGPNAGALPLAGAFLRRTVVGDRLRIRNATGGEDLLEVVEAQGAGRWARLDASAYLVAGMAVVRERADGGAREPEDETILGHLPARPIAIPLEIGDRLLLTRNGEPGAPARPDPSTGALVPARIGCLPAEALGNVRVGERIWFDDGRIGGLVRAVGEAVEVEITGAGSSGAALKAEKGINLPDSDLDLPPLTERDLEILPFIAEHADLVGYSFVSTPGDIVRLRSVLTDLGAVHLGIVLKIERVAAFENLPRLLLEGMRDRRLGVMIARGDLAVECGFARLAEVQEEILWVCAAGHVPVIWATQVMDRLAKKGRPSRAEITDAAMGERAECVMLNKGPHVVDAVRALVSIVSRMEGHQKKKRAMLRRLQIAAAFFEREPGPEEG
jgi:pyruvate kinase